MLPTAMHNSKMTITNFIFRFIWSHLRSEIILVTITTKFFAFILSYFLVFFLFKLLSSLTYSFVDVEIKFWRLLLAAREKNFFNFDQLPSLTCCIVWASVAENFCICMTVISWTHTSYLCQFWSSVCKKVVGTNRRNSSCQS